MRLLCHRLTLGSILLLALTAPALARCGPDSLEQAKLESITPDGDLILADSRKLRLAGLFLGEASLFLGEAGLKARLKPGDAVAVGLLSETKDRWSRYPAIVFTLSSSGAPQWLQERLLRDGQALARPEESLGDCWVLLKNAEASRRVQSPERAPEGGRFARIEGRVLRVSEGRSAHFITLFDASNTRVTGLIQKRHLKRFSDAGVDVAQLRSHFIRLRGVLSVRNASVIPLIMADQIEIVR